MLPRYSSSSSTSCNEGASQTCGIHHETAEYGDCRAARRVISEETREEMRAILDEIQSGEFATRMDTENMAEVVYNLKRIDSEHLTSRWQQLRSMIGWIGRKD